MMRYTASMDIATFSLENNLLEQGYKVIIGVDEAGRGPLAGPVVACATMVRNFEILNSNFETNASLQIPHDKTWDLVRDSKKLSEKQREKAFDFIHDNFHVGIGLCNHETIDRINILEASFLAMKKAVSELRRNLKLEIGGPDGKNQDCELQITNCMILVDGDKVIPNFSSMEQLAIIGGDGLIKSIAAASIAAKVTRDRMMLEAHGRYPQYGFDKHKGYGTKLHMDALAAYGPCPIHRKSFAPVRRCIKPANQAG